MLHAHTFFPMPWWFNARQAFFSSWRLLKALRQQDSWSRAAQHRFDMSGSWFQKLNPADTLHKCGLPRLSETTRVRYSATRRPISIFRKLVIVIRKAAACTSSYMFCVVALGWSLIYASTKPVKHLPSRSRTGIRATCPSNVFGPDACTVENSDQKCIKMQTKWIWKHGRVELPKVCSDWRLQASRQFGMRTRHLRALLWACR